MKALGTSAKIPRREDVAFRHLVGKTLASVRGRKGDDEIIFVCDDGSQFALWHKQECCECVLVEDICGDWSDILGSPILRAEENSSEEWPEDTEAEQHNEFFTWTFYRITTERGQVVIRWLGTSNGCYSERVDFSRLPSPEV